MSPNIRGGFGEADLDFVALAELHALCFEDCWSAETLRSLCSSKNYLNLYFYDDTEVITGVLLLQSGGLEADIISICVHPDKQRCGIANSLLNASFELLKYHGVNSVFLEVSEDNTAAYRTYMKSGFELVGTRKKYYNNGLSAYTMKKELDLTQTNHDNLR